MDIILKPDLVWIQGCCYRMPFLKDGEGSSKNASKQSDYYLEDADEDFRPCTDEPCDMEFDVEVLDSGRFCLRLPVPKVFWGNIIGFKGHARRRIEEETRTNLAIPRPTQVGDIVITGDNRRDVFLARSHIEATVRAARQRQDYTHFLSVPIQSEEIRHQFNKFKAEAQNICPSLPDEIFTFPERLHLTLVMLGLMDDRERLQANEMFQQLSEVLSKKVAGNDQTIRIKGVDIMNDDPSKARVLFAKAESSFLQEIANEAAAWFANSGFVKDRDLREEVKLHVTLMNARFLEKDDENADGSSGRRTRKGPRKEFNFGPVLENLRDFDFGTIPFKTIHLSQLGNHGEDGYYVSSATMKF